MVLSEQTSVVSHTKLLKTHVVNTYKLCEREKKKISEDSFQLVVHIVPGE